TRDSGIGVADRRLPFSSSQAKWHDPAKNGKHSEANREKLRVDQVSIKRRSVDELPCIDAKSKAKENEPDYDSCADRKKVWSEGPKQANHIENDGHECEDADDPEGHNHLSVFGSLVRRRRVPRLYAAKLSLSKAGLAGPCF